MKPISHLKSLSRAIKGTAVALQNQELAFNERLQLTREFNKLVRNAAIRRDQPWQFYHQDAIEKEKKDAEERKEAERLQRQKDLEYEQSCNLYS